MRLPSGKTVCDLLDKKQAQVTTDGCQQWTVPNAGARGYYRTALPPASLHAASARGAQACGDRALALLTDEWALVRAGRHDVGSFLDLASGYGSERTGQVMSSLANMLAAIGEDITADKSREPFRAWVAAARACRRRRRLGSGVEPAANRATMMSRARYARPSSTLWVASGEIPKCSKHARRLVEQELDKPGAVEPTLLDVLVNLAPLEGDAALYDKYVARSRSAVGPEEQYRYLYRLACFSDPALVRRTIDYAVGPGHAVAGHQDPGGGVARERRDP